jgi:hypothetical protein
MAINKTVCRQCWKSHMNKYRGDWEFEKMWEAGYVFCKAVMVRGPTGQYIKESIRTHENPPENCVYALEQVMVNE